MMGTQKCRVQFQLFVLVLIEHKSQPDQFVRLQLLQC